MLITYKKKKAKVTILRSNEEMNYFFELFERLFSKKNDIGNNKLDSSSLFVRTELLQYGFKPAYID